MGPKVLDRYIFLEIAVPFILSISMLTATALLSKVMKLIELAVVQGVGAAYLLQFVLSVMPSFLIYTIPISFLIAVLAAFGRLSSDSELTAMKASGLSLFTLLKPVAFAASIAVILTVVATMVLFPWGNNNIKKLLFEASRNALASSIEEKTFYDRFKGFTLYVDRVSQDTGEMEGIFLAQESSGSANIFFAGKGALAVSNDDAAVYFKLFDGTIHRQGAGDDKGKYNIVDFSVYTLDLGSIGDVRSAGRSNRELYAGELMDKAKAASAKGENAAPYLIDLHKRFALPASVIVFALLGVPLGIQKARQARSAGFSVALGVVLAYYVASTALEALGENGRLNPYLAVWGSDIIFACIGGYIFYQAAKDRTAFSSIAGLAARLRVGKGKSGRVQ